MIKYIGNIYIKSMDYQGTEIKKLYLGNNIAYWNVETILTPTERPYVKLTFMDGTTRTDYYDDGIIPNKQYISNNELFEVEIGDGITYIGEQAFYFCHNLQLVEIKEGVVSIDNEAFAAGTFPEVYLPNSLEELGENVFSYNANFQQIRYKGDKWEFDAIEKKEPWLSNVSENPILVCNDGEYPVFKPYNPTANTYVAWCDADENWTIDYYDDGIIPDSAYLLDTSITKVEIGEEITEIGKKAFDTCLNLTSVIISYNVTTIGNFAFSNCRSLTSVTIPNSVTEIGDFAFQYCPLTSVTIPDSVTRIGDDAFYRCDLRSATIGNGVTSIGNYAFYNCSYLENITIGNSVGTIGIYAFAFCTALKSISYDGTSTQFSAISKGSSWKMSVPTTCTVHCTDGYFLITLFN